MTYRNLRFSWGLGCCALHAFSIPYLGFMFRGLLTVDELMTVLYLMLPVTSISVVTFFLYCTTGLPDGDKVVPREQFAPAVFILSTVTVGLVAMPWIYTFFPVKPAWVKGYLVLLESYSGGGLAWFSNFIYKVAKVPATTRRKRS